MIAEPLTDAQLGIWLGHQRANDPSLYNCGEVTEIRGPFSPTRFQSALRECLASAAALHVAYREMQGEPRRVRVPLSLDFSEFDLSLEPDPERTLDRLLTNAVAEPYDLAVAPAVRHRLYRLAEDHFVWFHGAHHLALDGFGFHLVARALADKYEGRPGRSFESMAPVFEADAEYRASAERRRDEEFWHAGPLSQIRGVCLAGDRTLPLPELPRRQTAAIDSGHFEALRRLARREKLSWSELLLALVSRYVYERTGRARFALGLPVMLRMGSPALWVPCMAMNIVRLPVVVAPGATWLDVARSIRARLALQSPHHRFRYEQLKSEGQADPSFGPVVNIQPFERPQRLGEATLRTRVLWAGPTQDLSFAFEAWNGSLQLHTEGHPALYAPMALAALQRELCGSFEEVLRQPERVVRPRFQVSPGVDSAAPSLAMRIAARAQSTPRAGAIEAEGRRFEYRELHQAALAFAARLHERGVQPGDLIGIDLPRAPGTIAVLLGCWYAGCGYLALDGTQSQARRARLLQLARVAVLVSAADPAVERENETSLVRVTLPNGALWELEGLGPSGEHRIADQLDGTRTAYVVYTSGSTGEPKGVVVPQSAVSFFVNAAVQAYELSPNDRVLQFAPLTFDASVEEIWATLAAGATLVLRDDAMLETMATFTQRCEELALSVLDLPTAFWHELSWAVEHGGVRIPACVRTVIIGGEAALPERVSAWLTAVPHARLLNTYGPSEATVVATVANLQRYAPDEGGVPIGRPLPGVGALVLDADGEPFPEGPCSGELCLYGPGLASGYLHRPDLTRERFPELNVPEPLRVYRTGDRVRRLADGSLIFAGRVDSEIKLSGYRICPEEVEAALTRHPGVRGCIVRAWREGGRVGLQAELEAEPYLDVESVRRFAAEQLPGPMVPATFVVHARLPRSANGKLDRARLPPVLAGGCPSAPTQEAQTAIERAVYDVWREVLGKAPRSRDEDFFAAGGQSLQVIQLANRLSRTGAPVSVARIFQAPTPAGLVRVLSQADPSADAPTSDWAHVAPVASMGFAPRQRRQRPLDDAEHVVLTGATGFLGIHLLDSILRHTRARVHCAVRAGNETEARARLEATARAYRLELPVARVHAVPLDLSSGEDPAQALAAQVPAAEAVIHAAAQVSLTRDFSSLKASNVDATRAMLRFAAGCGARLHHVSSVAVLPHSQNPVGESFFPAHAGLVDGYQQSKWHAEQLCRSAIEHGLDVTVHRLGRVAPARRSPVLNGRDLVWRVARTSVRCRAWPALDVREPWTPVDEAAETLVRLAIRLSRAAEPERSERVFHLVQNGSFHLDRLRTALVRAGYALETVPLGEWLARALARADDEDRTTLSFFELQAQRASTLQADIECKALERVLPDLARTPITDSLLDAYCAAAIQDGLFAAPLSTTPLSTTPLSTTSLSTTTPGIER